jgi:CubicO group peptidase (beta-lactamase class C family)
MDVIRYMLGQPFDFEPGDRYAYSNFGYCLLGRVIEAVTGQPYEKAVRQRILAPIGITRMRLGATLESGRAEGEVRYYTADKGLAANVFPGDPTRVAWPYGGFYLEAMDAHGGWIGSALDLARFMAALYPGKPRLPSDRLPGQEPHTLGVPPSAQKESIARGSGNSSGNGLSLPAPSAFDLFPAKAGTPNSEGSCEVRVAEGGLIGHPGVSGSWFAGCRAGAFTRQPFARAQLEHENIGHWN